MAMIANYTAFEGVHWETGSVRNALAAQGVIAPHTGQAISEALLLGISGGVAVGYFVFEYVGYDPQFTLLTRNTFDPMPTLLDRLGIKREVKETVTPSKAIKYLTDALNEGKPALVWADIAGLSYNGVVLDAREDYPMMFPIVVYGYADDKAYIADRARVPLVIAADELDAARKKQARQRNRLMTLSAPNFDTLSGAVEAGLRQCVALYLDAPPKGTKDNFGLAALQKWANMLVDEKDKRGWAALFPRGRALLGALSAPFTFIETWGTEGAASRGQYADFLGQAALILNKPALRTAAEHFRETIPAWHDLAVGLLPEAVEPLRALREGMLHSRALFVERGAEALPERRAIREELAAQRMQMNNEFPMSDADIAALRADVRERVLRVHAVEQVAVMALKDAIG
ncbi:MAG: BtrH N-terminal domain-containing protein [Chloroflexota bacterium]|nr:BtrH N-terminal domain-containing protein [Chloroflexota bacterium]